MVYTAAPGLTPESPPSRVRRKIDVARTDLEGWPVYEISPKPRESVALNGHVLYLHGGYYVLDFAPQFHWPMVATLALTCVAR